MSSKADSVGVAIDAPQEAASFPVVGIGASAGGLSALGQLLGGLQQDTGMALVIVQHLDPHHESQLSQILGKDMRHPVVQATEGEQIQPDHVYVIPPNAELTISEGKLHLSPRTKDPHLPIDTFFRSLAAERHEHAIGVILSGTGSDGSMGLGSIKDAGGITFAQDEDSAEYPAMPQSAVASGCVDFVLSPDRIAAELIRISHHPYLRTGAASDAEPQEDSYFRRILSRLRSTTGVDFSEYRDTTIKRRIARRMALHKHESFAEYDKMLEADASEVLALYGDMLINVTSFFRDPEVFEALKSTVFPQLLSGRSAERPVRIWVPGCATGEEAYSLAMSLFEFLDTQTLRPPIQIFGTDINDGAALEKARPGVYPQSIETDVSPARLSRFFNKVDGGYRISQLIRDACIFARQNVAADPPFSRLDLISCRNVLIYLSPSLQQRIIPTFHYALNPGAFLLLGPSESVGKFSDLFERADADHNIYVRRVTLAPVYPNFVGLVMHGKAEAAVPADQRPAITEMRREADRALLARFSPPSVLVDETLEILQFRGQTGPYLRPPTGQPTHNLLRMAHESLFMDLRAMLDEAMQDNTTARRTGIRFEHEQELRYVDLEASPIQPYGLPQRCFLVLFMEAGPEGAPRPQPAPRPAPATSPTVADNEVLRQELASVKTYLQSVIEQQNAANEELQSANEEARSSNEELQSTNEELQTAKEELQSINEELHTVNDELQSRIGETTRLSNDLSNTLASIRLPIIMIGADLRIRRYTAAAASLLGLKPADLGQPFTAIRTAFDLPELEEQMLRAIESAAHFEQEVQDGNGRWYLLSLYPYRTEDRRIDGLVLLLRDIDTDNRRLLQAAEAKDHFLAVLSHELRTPLSPVLATVSVLQRDEKLGGDIRRHLEMIRRNVEMEAHLIDDLLDVTRLSRGKLELDRRPTAVCQVVQAAVEVCKPDIEAHKLDIQLDIEPESHEVYADATRLQQVFWNLLKNAVKFTPDGGRILVRCTSDAQRATVSVTDSGMGISPAELPRLFKAFQQGEHGSTRNFGGLGLGLSISRHIVEMHGGKIEASSPGKGQGATFTVTLPTLASRGPGKPPSQTRDVTAKSASLRILLVEDHRDTARILGQLLTLNGHVVEVAHDVATAVRMAGEKPFDLLLSDLGLPDGSGIDLIKNLHQKGVEMPAIALSGYGQEKDIKETRAAGFAAHLVKPVDPRRLEEVITATVSGADE